MNRLGKKIKAYPHQREAIKKLRTGSILRGGVGSGKTLTALLYFLERVLIADIVDGEYKIRKTMPLYIITTARKRDSLDWEKELSKISITKNSNKIEMVVDSWNNIKKYVDIENAFFIFDEQRVLGYGVWVKSFLKITKNCDWILLSATPGDRWNDYIPVFIANGFYRNKTDFSREHIVYSPYSKFPKIQKYVGVGRLKRLKESITVDMLFERKTIHHDEVIFSEYDREKFKTVFKNRWNVFDNKPIKENGKLYYLMRRVVNSDPSRLDIILQLYHKHKKIIVFYNFNYELEILRSLKSSYGLTFAEYNGHKHEPVPKGESWVYAVQYTSGSEAWNCIETNTLIFYSLNYSYMKTVQSKGRIDRINTPYTNLYYYTIRSRSYIDAAIAKALKEKRNFNEKPL